jgi:hypothetical protein
MSKDSTKFCVSCCGLTWPSSFVHRKATISVVEMRRLCWVCGKVRYDRIRDDNIRERFGVGHIVEKWWKRGVGVLGM